MEKVFRFADVNVGITALHPRIYSLCGDYAVEGPADFTVSTDQADIDFERARSTHPGVSDPYLECLAVYRKIAERVPEYGVFLFHGSAIAVDGRGYIFAAASGTGKSTHARLWRSMLSSRAVMINDDKPLIRVTDDGAAAVYGTPWDGKHHLSRNISVPLRAVCVLERSRENHIEAISKQEAMPALVRQTYRPMAPAQLARILALLDRMDARFYHLRCNMDPEAALISYNAMKEA